MKPGSNRLPDFKLFTVLEIGNGAYQENTQKRILCYYGNWECGVSIKDANPAQSETL